MAKPKVNSKRFDPYKNFKFRIKMDGSYVAGVSARSLLVDRITEDAKTPDAAEPQIPGNTAVFVGEKGAGKKSAAEEIAARLGRHLHRVDLSAVASKYIGETEKNLDRVLQEAKDSGAVLFIDEADALFGKRSEVKDSHDRYANIEIDHLLQRLEEYPGLAILATNMKDNLDDAFTRRMRYVVEF
jgi:SpoVK/Ycf46/Vps4 family AAA+-type ATPase